MNDAQHAKSLKGKYGKRIAALKKHRDDVEREIYKLTSKYQSKCRHSKLIDGVVDDQICALCGKWFPSTGRQTSTGY